MEQEQKFFLCRRCGNLIGLIQNAGVPMICCGEKMEELEANRADGSAEKHKPVVQVTGVTVKVDIGAAGHPMEEDHKIDWVYVQTSRGGQRKSMAGCDSPTVQFVVTEDDKPLAVFAYCNLHGLWKTTADEFQS